MQVLFCVCMTLTFCHDFVAQPFETRHKGPLGVWPPTNKAVKTYSGLGPFWIFLGGGGARHSLKRVLVNVTLFILCLKFGRLHLFFSPGLSELGLMFLKRFGPQCNFNSAPLKRKIAFGSVDSVKDRF